MFAKMFMPRSRCCLQLSKVIGAPIEGLLRPISARHSPAANFSVSRCGRQRAKVNSALRQTPVKRFSTSLAVSYDDDLDPASEVVGRISEQLETSRVGRLFAVVHVAGKQRKVTAEDIIVLDKFIDADIGQRIRLNKVLLVGSKDFTLLGRPVLHADAVRVEATVIEKTLTHTMTLFHFHRRQDHRQLKLKKLPLTYLRINTISLSAIEK